MAEPIVQLLPKDEGFHIELRRSEPSFGKGELTKREFILPMNMMKKYLNDLRLIHVNRQIEHLKNS